MSISPSTVGFISLGCPKALVDSERILTQLRLEGYEISQSYEDANIVVVNTCGFIDSARAESLEAISEAIDENGKVIVTGCLGVKEAEIREAYPQVLSVSGPQQYEQVLSAVREYVPIQRKPDPFIDLVPEQGMKLTPRHYAYLKISEGCNHKCSFCIIPSMRGKLRSRLIDDILREAEALVRAGVRELLIISQDTSAYGSDIKYESRDWKGRQVASSFEKLCEELGQLGVWVRLHYVYPYPHVDKVVPLMSEGKILPYLDIPFQHGSRSVLQRMKRPAATENTLERIQKWRSICRQITIRSTFIVGFPGETDEEFEELLEFLEEAQLDRVGCFQYSAVEGAKANALDGQVAEELKQERWERFMQLQQEISTTKLEEKVGTRIKVLVDEINGDEIIARSEADAPEIDGVVYVSSGSQLNPGDLVEAEVESSSEYDLWARELSIPG